MKIILATILFLSTAFFVNAQPEGFYKSVDHIMRNYVNNGMVNYSALKTDPTQLNEIVDLIKKTDLKSLNDAEFVAFVINAYNMLVIFNVVNNYPTKGPLAVKGFFAQKSFAIGSVVLSLDDLEKKILFGKTKDSRLHFALSCAAVGCPPLTNTVYMPNTVYGQLKEQAASSINNANFIKIDRAKKVVQLSQIFDWYSLHFGSSKKEQIAYLNKYLKEPITSDYKIKYYTYDWNLNDWKG
ncbi:MAG: DUF547 domain-containing protein [Cyclobacteriaceae bacterium]|nr:DUF547 domain-containing protein [Cyclobacteriaceae bacterium]